jgi:hypothetical protein
MAEAVKMSRKDKDKLAKVLQKELSSWPDLTISALAKKTDNEDEVVREIIDTYRADHLTPKHVGPGKGGGWISNPDD